MISDIGSVDDVYKTVSTPIESIIMESAPPFLYVLASLILPAYIVYRRLNRVSIADIPGPKPESWFLGNYRQLLQGQVGEADSRWQEQYGDIVRIKGPFGTDSLIVNDPKALQYIYNNSGADFDKQHVRQEILGLATGRGLVWAEGDVHRRQRKVANPAFGAAEVKSYVPWFLEGASRLTEKWKNMIEESNGSSLSISITDWLERATLDVIGETAFGYEFNALENDNNDLARLYQTCNTETFVPPSSSGIIVRSLLSYLPHRLLQWYFDYAPVRSFRPARELTKIAREVAKTLVETKRQEALVDGKKKVKRDILGLMVRANLNKSDDAYLTDEELWATVTTILGAGHESTSNTLTWGLQELARQPDVQNKLRKEIIETWNEALARGDTEPTSADYDKMKYTTAVIKEILRFYPVSHYNPREANQDQVIPLSKPLLLKNGKTVTEITVPKGTEIFTPPFIYNRNKNIFGGDAHLFNPDRWLNHKLDTTSGAVGVYGNMMTFGSGVRACIGWRFAVYNMQSFLIELIKNFQFEPTPILQTLRKESCIFMMPIVEGELAKGPQMPLKVSFVNNEED